MNWALALLTAALLIAGQPGPDVSWLAWLALAPLIFAVAREPRAGHRFLLGWTAGIVYWFVHCNWIEFVLEYHGGMGWWGGWGSFLLFCMLKAIHLGVFAMVAGWLTGRWWSPAAVAALWAGLERTHGTFGFAWLALGNAGIDMGPVARIAPLAGVYAISFLFAIVAAAMAERRFAWLALIVVPFVLPPLSEIPATDSAVVLQPNLDEAAEWTTASALQMQQRLVTESLETVMKTKSRLLIWPEAPAPLYFFTDPQFQRAATDLARTSQASFLFGTVAYTKAGAPLNSAVMLSPGGELLGRYDKIFLVPFGEFVPPPFGFVHQITKEAGSFEAGTGIVTFPFGSHKIGAFICYESAFPQLVRRFRDSDVYVNISNDGYFGRSYAREQHLKLVRMRAIENSRWIVRSTNDGITAVVNPAGRITQRMEPYKELVARLEFGYNNQQTFYSRHGDWFAWSSLITACGLVLITRRRAWAASKISDEPLSAPR